MLIAYDVGNSYISIGLFEYYALKRGGGNKLLKSFRVETRKDIGEDEFGSLMTSLFSFPSSGLSSVKIDGIICGSVVPSLDKVIYNVGKRCFDKESLFVSHRMDLLGLSFSYPTPSELGADRIINAVCALNLYSIPSIIIDFGTATTYCVINEKGEYLGGLIVPGLMLSLEALKTKAEKLKSFEVDEFTNCHIIGKSTKGAIKSGIYFSTIGQIEGILRRIKEEYNLPHARVIATGGLCAIFKKASPMIDIFDINLTLKGLELLFYKNAKL